MTISDIRPGAAQAAPDTGAPPRGAHRLTQQVLHSIAHPATTDAFDIHREFDSVLADLGLTRSDVGGTIRFEGADPIVPSTIRLAGATAIALMAKAAAMAHLWRFRGGSEQDMSIDLRGAPRRLCPFYEGKWELVNGLPPIAGTPPNDAFAMHRFYRTADGRWMLPLNPYPKLAARTCELLQVPEETTAVARAISRWDGETLEQAGADFGVVMPMVRTTEEFLQTLQYREILSQLPLIKITKIGDSEPVPLPMADLPLSGVRALGMGHVIAGSGIGRALALHGADVLNLWRLQEVEQQPTFYTTNVGHRSARVNPYSTVGRAKIAELLCGADVFFANRRPGYLEKIGLSAEEAAATKPGIVYATVNLHGGAGPWGNRVGFDQVAGAVSGIMYLEGGAGEKPSVPPVPVVNDNIVGWLIAAGVAEALRRRAVEGGSWRVDCSLTRTALWILSLGIFDLDYAIETAGQGPEHAFHAPELFTADTPLGHYQGVTDQVQMSKTPGHYDPVLVPLGSCYPEWR
jgi:crotonobetainyl-CoA:carnitine CoA-transferase CaiB-like acyl-CoA transferase